MSGLPATPRPWRVGDGNAVVCDAQHEGNHQFDEESLKFYGGYLLAESIMRKADAVLMAAAPDLLDALEMVRDADEDCRRDGIPRALTAVARTHLDKVIAKARGGA